MNQEKNKGAEYDFYGKLPLQKAILLGLQHVFAMFVGNLTPVLIITGACGIASGTEFADVQIALLQNAMLIARNCYTDPVVRDRTDRWKSSNHHGNEFRIYRCLQQCCICYGWWNPWIWCDHGCFHYRWVI